MIRTPSEVEHIAAETDPALRNLRITQCYCNLSAAVGELIPGGANWCTFATWASKQAGQTIRHEDLENLVRTRLEGIVPEIAVVVGRSQLIDHLNEVIGELGPLRRSGAQVAEGNRKVFAEIGLLFARFLEAAAAEAKFAEFLAGMRPGGPPDGQDLLVSAFRGYKRAIELPAGKPRAELLLLSNLQVGLHEQMRLQPQIQGALDGSIVTAEDIDGLLLGKLRARRGMVARVLDRFLPSRLSPLRELTRALAGQVRELIRIAITDHLMTLTFPPDRVLRLGRDVPGTFPADLVTIANPDLVRVLGEIDPTSGSTAGSGAIDWANFSDRMHYIADLFRVFQADARLFDPPFDAAQEAGIDAGRVPPGPL
jgi:hypothetical protein